MPDRRLRWGWLCVAVVSIAVVPALWEWIGSAHEQRAELRSGAAPRFPASQAQVAESHDFTPRRTQYGWSHFLLWVAGSHELASPRAEPLAVATDPVDSAPDLKRVFDDYIDSDDPRQRRTAMRAFEACIPAFLPAAGQSPSPEPLIDALPPDHRTEREAAYRALFARCQRLLADGRASLDATSQSLQRDPQIQTPALRAQEAALAGRFDRIEPLVTEVLHGADPAAVMSLAGLAARIVALRQPGGADAAMLEYAHEVDAALPLVACDLGLDCSAQSLWALQLCAAEGLCEGDVAVRLMARNSPGSVDAGAVQQQRLRLLGLIRSGRALGTADLLPL